MKSERLKVKSGRTASRARLLPAYSVFYFLLLTFNFSLFTTVSAQDDPTEIAPPPLKIFSKAERSRLDAKIAELKDRTKLSLELMGLRLDAAEKFAGGQQFEAMFAELGGFQALMDDSLDYLNRRNTGSDKKVLDGFKRIEIGLRGFSPRIETMRRELPIRYDDYVRKLMKFVRDARTKATEPFFSDSVVKTKS